MFVITPKDHFDRSYFTKRELRIMETLAREYNLANADEMVEATHLPTLPWHRVYEVEGRKWQQIPYDYSLSDANREVITALAAESREMLHNYQ